MNKSLSIVGFGLKRAKADFYPTPRETTEALFKREIFRGLVWECASGNGAMARVIENYNPCFASDIRTDESIYGQKGIDFLVTDKEVPNIVTNPPYILAKQFVEWALICATEKVAMLLKLVFLESAGRYYLFRNSPLRTVYVFSKRQKIYAEGKIGKNSGLIAYAWFVWDKNYSGKPYLDWIND